MRDIEFEVKCVALIEKVQKTRQPFRITRRGSPVVEVIPAGIDHKRYLLGDVLGTAETVGDIVSSVICKD